MPRDASESHSTFLLTKQWPSRNFLGLLTVADTDHPSFKITVQWVHGMSSQSAWLTNNVHVSTNLQGALQITVILDCKFRSDVRVCVTLEPKYTSLYPGNRISCFHEQTFVLKSRRSPTSTGIPLYMHYSATEVQMTFGGIQYPRVPWIRIGLPNIAKKFKFVPLFG